MITAMDDGWSVSRLKDEIKARATPAIVPLKDRVLAVPDINEILPHYPNITGLHPACEIMPLMTEREFWGLVDSVKRHGFHGQMTVTEDGLLVDGKHRLMACFLTETTVWPYFFHVVEEYEDPWSLSYSLNVLRTQLTPEQYAEMERIGFELELKIAADRGAE